MLHVPLTDAQRADLEALRDRDPRPCLRERAAAILKVAQNQSAVQVARTGLPRPRHRSTVERWVRRFREQGGPRPGDGSPGRGTSPRRQGQGASPPAHPSDSLPGPSRPLNLRATLAGPPPEHPRWTLWRIREQVPALRARTLPGVWRQVRQAGIRYKRGRDYVHSPGPANAAKAGAIQAALAEARAAPGRVALLYLDEKSYSHQPAVAAGHHVGGHSQPLARRSHASMKWRRIVGALDAVTGQVLFEQGGHVGARVFCGFLRQVRAAYPEAERRYVVLDNWRQVHAHPTVREEAARQGVTLLYLPAYAPWLNPIEKLWRWLCQEVPHLHRQAEDWPGLQAAVAAFLSRFAQGGTAATDALLRYVGLATHNTVALSC